MPDAVRSSLTDRGVQTLCTAVALLPKHAELLPCRSQRLVAAAGRRFARDGRDAAIRIRHWEVVTDAAALFMAAEFGEVAA